MSSSKINFFFIDVRFSFIHRTKLKRFIRHIFKKDHKKVSYLNYIFCSDKYLLKINSKYLGHNYYTDILTFDISDTSMVSAEIYISIDRVKENAKTFNTPFSTELKRVIFHGVLHLLGYKDRTTLEISLMRKREEELLDAWRCFT